MAVEEMVVDRWDAELNGWRHWLVRKNEQTQVFEKVCETDELGNPLKEETP